tara:strand:+ start:1277 stop:1816 length:540 start_codon:yes stop_codon:yes gene_type:complete
MTENNDWLVIGIITSAHGINGKLKIRSLSDFKERFTTPGQRWIQKDNEIPLPYTLISGYQKPGKDSFIISLQEIDNRNKAEMLKQYKLLVKNDDIPELKNNEFHLNEVLNLKVKLLIDNELIIIGKVIDFITEKNNLLVVNLNKNNKKVLIPFVREIVTTIDKKNNFLIIDPPKGLLEL